MGLGAVGLWWGLVTGLTVAAVLLSWRFQRITRTMLNSTAAVDELLTTQQHRPAVYPAARADGVADPAPQPGRGD